MFTNKMTYISTMEAAKILGISRMQVVRKIKSGEIKANRVGRSFVIPINELNPIFKTSSADELRRIEKGVEKVVEEYGDVLKKLGRE